MMLPARPKRIFLPASLAVVVTIIAVTSRGQVAEITNAKALDAKKEFEKEIADAVSRYVVKLETASKAAANDGNFDEAKAIADKKKSLETHGISTTPDPTKKSKRILLANIFKITDGAVLEFRANYTAYGRHNDLTTNWVMTDPQTLIMGATRPTKPLYIYKFDKTLSRGTVYKYQPVTNEKRRTITRSRK